ncbi:uncharacterized protein LOC120893075 [Ictidomys tridecemlineatus]
MAGSHWADTESCQRSTSVTRCLPPPSPAAAGTHGRASPGASGSAPHSAAAAQGRGGDGHRRRAAQRPAAEKWETPVRKREIGTHIQKENCMLQWKNRCNLQRCKTRKRKDCQHRGKLRERHKTASPQKLQDSIAC